MDGQAIDLRGSQPQRIGIRDIFGSISHKKENLLKLI